MPRSRVPPSRQSRRIFLSATMALFLGIAGCGQFTPPEQQLSVAVGDAQTAAETSRLAVSQLDRNRITRGVAKTALSEMLTVVDAAATTLAGVTVTSGKQRDLRTHSLRQVEDVKSAILAVQDTNANVPGSGDLRDRLRQFDTVLKALAKLTKQLPEPR
jgi:hypothetical protein